MYSSVRREHYVRKRANEEARYTRRLTDAGITNCRVRVRYTINGFKAERTCLVVVLDGLPDFMALADMSVQSLHLASPRPRVSDLTPLKGMPLHGLIISDTKVSDLTPLLGMPLKYLHIDGTLARDLTPLTGMRLMHLRMHSTKVTDLTPLRGMPLEHLELDETEISDLTPLGGMGLQSLTFTPNRITNGIDIIRKMTSLEDINGLDADEFWTRYDAGEFVKEAAPAE